MKTEISKMMAARKRELSRVSRKFPKFTSGMTVAEYCYRYSNLNSIIQGGLEASVLPLNWDALHHVPTAYDPSFPEVTEEAI